MSILSECCDAEVIFHDICSACGEHCDSYDDEYQDEESPQSILDREESAIIRSDNLYNKGVN